MNIICHGTITMENGAEPPFELYPEDAPRTVENFVKLTKEDYYGGKTLHRVIKNFVSQGDCPYGTGAGDLGYTIPCETTDDPHKHKDGSLFMAHRGKDIGCYQFSICHCPQPCLDGVHTVFGKVIDNLGVIRNMRNGDVMKKVVIEKV